MADSKFSALTLVGSVTAALEWGVNEAGTSKRANAQQLKDFVYSAGSATAGSWPKFSSGTLLTTAEAGAEEYDGKAFYQTCVAGTRQVVDTEQFLSLSATQSATNGLSAQTWFPGGGATSFNLAAATSYFFEGILHLAHGATTHTTALNFAGAATITSIKYNFLIASVTENTAGVAPLMGTVNQAASTVLNATSGATGTQIWIKGIVRINAAGTFIPQFTWSAAPGVTTQVLLNSFFRIWPVGSNTVLGVGNLS